MKKMFEGFFWIFLVFGMVTVSAAATIDFQNYPDNNDPIPMVGEDVSRLDWSAWGVIFSTPNAPLNIGQSSLPASQNNCLGSANFKGAIQIELTGTLVAQDLSLYVCNVQHSSTITVTAYNLGGTQVDVRSVPVPSDDIYEAMDISFSGIQVHKLVVADSSGTKQFGIDDVSSNVIGASVPIPGAVWLLGSGLVGLLGLRKRMKK